MYTLTTCHHHVVQPTTGQPLANNRNRQTVTARIIYSERSGDELVEKSDRNHQIKITNNV